MGKPGRKKFFVTGGSGFLGWNICRFLKNRYQVFASYHSHPAHIEGCQFFSVDLTNKSQVFTAVGIIRPSVIIHTAAISSPDMCEKDRSKAFSVNVAATYNVALAAQKYGSRMVYLSTDQVFDGKRCNYTETDNPNPVNYYAFTKLEGEKVCLNTITNTIVIRITLQYGWGSGIHTCFIEWLKDALKSGRQVVLFTDQYRTPTYAMDTAKGLALASLGSKPGEIYHLAAPDRMNRYEFGLLFARIFQFPESLIKGAPMKELLSDAPRPADVSLCGQKFFRHFHFRPRPVVQALKAMAKTDRYFL